MDWYVPLGTAVGGPFTPSVAMTYPALRVLELPVGGAHTLATGDAEMIVLPLAGGCRVTCDDDEFDLAGRDSVFSAVSDFCYLPHDALATVVNVARRRVSPASPPPD